MLSDVFTDKAQFEWMLSVFLNIHRSHPAEDELSMQYLIVGVCKAAAVVGLVSRLCICNSAFRVFGFHYNNINRIVLWPLFENHSREPFC